VLTSLDHVVLAVADLDAATATYSRLFGRGPSWRGAHRGYGTANTLFRLRNTYVELLAPAGDGPVAELLQARIASDGEGPLGLAFGTDDASATAVELRARALSCPDPAEGAGRESTSGARREWRNAFLPTDRTRGVQLIVIQHLSAADALPAARAHDASREHAAVSGVDHVVVMSGDAEACIALYRDSLGLRLALDRTFDERGMRLLFFRVGGITVECAVPLGAGALPTDTDRFWGVSYRVDDVAAARERLAREGFDVSEVRTGMKPGTRVCTVRRETHGVATLLIGPDES
jgi:catechol 2,3-dioxygenase-like lactoylglutathione lyase family enzyme